MTSSPTPDANIHRLKAPVAVDFESARGVLLLAFGGLAGSLRVPLFEFFDITSSLQGINKIFVRDLRKVWYHAGLPGIARDIEGTAAFLRQYTEHASTRRVVAVGNSGGGYAALLFGHMLHIDEVHAFSPRTFISPLRRVAIGDVTARGNAMSMARLLLFHRAQSRLFDVKKVLERPAGPTQSHIHYAADHRIDRLHARRMEGLPGVCLHAYSFGSHQLIRYLKENGQLVRIIERAVDGHGGPEQAP